MRHILGILPRPVLLSLRNTFRRRGRLLLTLSTLTMAGTIFIGVLNLRASLLATVDTMLNFNQYDVWITLVEPQRMQKIEQIASANPNVVDVEGWAFIQSRRIYAEGGEGSMVFGFFLPPDSSMVEPIMMEGRWLQPADERAIVVSSALMRDEPDLQLGSELIIKIEGEEERWTIVGVIQSLGPFAYAPYDTYAKISGETGRAAIAMVQLRAGSAVERAAQIPLLEQGFEAGGMRVSSIISLDQERAEVEAAFNVLTGLLMVMAGLLAAVGGLGLTSTMSLNVLERTREIGVMRAIGANSGAVFQVVVAEGICIGMISWLLAALLALAANQPLSAAFGIAFINAPLSAALAPLGSIIWLIAILLLAVVASILPAWRATRLTIRAVLAYE
jgi:putative ABC transport system permease protein